MVDGFVVYGISDSPGINGWGLLGPELTLCQLAGNLPGGFKLCCAIVRILLRTVIGSWLPKHSVLCQYQIVSGAKCSGSESEIQPAPATASDPPGSHRVPWRPILTRRETMAPNRIQPSNEANLTGIPEGYLSGRTLLTHTYSLPSCHRSNQIWPRVTAVHLCGEPLCDFSLLQDVLLKN